jgi:hypothetical protein
MLSKKAKNGGKKLDKKNNKREGTKYQVSST